ncbi:hypothetical protein GCK72_024720 [Caenorhabditis remanei]|nr:hypothetical protein GCK72_024720 [Caenorhabditis remanei]KAF1748253.1 hypothetical protein GCK72_024720 [Caenorhabditis remanei]
MGCVESAEDQSYSNVHHVFKTTSFEPPPVYSQQPRREETEKVAIKQPVVTQKGPQEPSATIESGGKKSNVQMWSRI